MAKLQSVIRWYTNNRAVVALLGLMVTLEILFIARTVWPASFQFILDKHIFEFIVILGSAQMILMLFRLLERVPKHLCKDEHECQVLLRNVVRDDPRAFSLCVFSSGLGSRLDMITTIHSEARDTFYINVVAQDPVYALDKQDAERMKAHLAILRRDHSNTPVEIRYFETPAAIRAMILCGRNRKPFWGSASWYRYEKVDGGTRVVGKGNPAIVLNRDNSTEDGDILDFLMKTFDKQWKECHKSIAFGGNNNDSTNF